ARHKASGHRNVPGSPSHLHHAAGTRDRGGLDLDQPSRDYAPRILAAGAFPSKGAQLGIPGPVAQQLHGLLLALGLSAQEAGERSLATEVVSATVRENRLDVARLGSIFARL